MPTARSFAAAPSGMLPVSSPRSTSSRDSSASSSAVTPGMSLGGCSGSRSSCGIDREETLHLRVDVIVAVSDVTHELSHDLRIRLPIETMALGAGGAEDLDERVVNGAPSGAVAPEQRAIDVEQHHDRRSPRH